MEGLDELCDIAGPAGGKQETPLKRAKTEWDLDSSRSSPGGSSGVGELLGSPASSTGGRGIHGKTKSRSRSNSVRGPKKTIAKAKGDKKKKKQFHGPCRVCGLIFDEMPEDFPYCFPHKKEVSALRDNLATQIKKTGSDEAKASFADFSKKRDEAGDPPSEFSRMVLTFSKECPSKGPGVSRKAFDYVIETESVTNKTVSRSGWKCVKMHKERWYLWCKNNDFDSKYATGIWEDLDRTTPEDKRDMLGPEHSKLQLPCPIEAYIVGENETAHEKSARMESNKKNEEDGGFHTDS
jgi:hypothetical protein